MHLCRHTFASLWGDCLRIASHWRANSCGDSSVLGVHFLNVSWGLLFVFVTRTYFKSFLWAVFWKCVRLLPHASMKPSCLARRPLCHCKFTELCSSAAVVPHKGSLPSCVVGRGPLYHKVSLPRCEARRRHFIMTCDILGTGQTNVLSLCYFFGKNLYTSLK